LGCSDSSLVDYCPCTAAPSLSRTDSDDSSASTLSSASSLSILDDPASHATEAPLVTAETRGRPSAARLNEAWQSFFRDALHPLDPAPVPALQATPPALPPPLNPAPNDPVGDPFTECDDSTFRVWSQNANGLSIKDDYAAWHELCANLVSKNPSVIALSEPNIDFLQQDVRRNIEAVFKLHFGHVRLVTATTCVRAPTPWKPGGVLLAVLGKWAQQVTTTSRDDLGRWVAATLCGSEGKQVTIFSCYNVVKASIANVGPSTVFAQQYQLLRLAGNAQPNPRKQFADDLKHAITARRHNQEELILCGDFNEQLGDDPNLMSNVCAANDLFDVLDNRFGDDANVPTYIRGSTRLDYVFASSGLHTHVKACGLNLFNEVIFSDHRAHFADFSLTAYLGNSPPTVVRSDLRFISTDSADVSKFIEKTYDHLDENKVFHKFQEFLLDVDVSARPWDLANSIDLLIGQAFQCAEADCAKPRRPPWSIKLHKASKKVRFWKTALTQRRTGISQAAILHELGTTIWGDDIPKIPHHEKSLINVGRAAEKALSRIRKNAKAERTQFLHAHRERLALRVTPKDTQVEDAIKTIDKQLADNRMFGRIQAAVKPRSAAALTKVELVDETEHVNPATGARTTIRKVQTIDTKKELEAAIIERNQRHFAQAEGTPFTRSPLNLIASANGFNTFKDVTGADITLPDSAFIETQTVLDILRERSQDPCPEWSPTVTFDDFINALLHWREETATSPSGRHLGIYRSLVTAYCDSSDEFSERDHGLTVQEKAEAILQVIFGLAEAASRLGFYLKRWTQVVNVMIYKKLGCIELNKLRVIHLFEADFNLLVGLFFGRRAMYHQVDKGLLHAGQFGKPGGECQDAAFSKVLTNLVSDFSKTPIGQFESDATACFDREVMNFVFACFKSTGAPAGPLRMWDKALFNVVHRVKTAFGLSNASYDYTADSPIHGPGQGSKGGPASCSTMTSALIEAMDRLAHGTTFLNPAQTIQYASTVKMFIDDASNLTAKFLKWLHQPPTAQEVTDLLAHDAQTWERLLWTSGGLLNLTKCLYYVSFWTFDLEGRGSLTPQADLPQLLLTNGNSDIPVPVAHYNFDAAHSYLGNKMAPNFQMTAAYAQILNTSNQFAKRLAASPLSRHDAWIAYFAVYIPQMTYTLCLTAHSAKKLRKLQSKALRATLNKLGFNRNTPHAVAFGPCIRAGLSMRDLPTEQGIALLLIIIRHLRSHTAQTKILLIALSWWQLVMGTSFSLLAHPDQVLLHDEAHIFSATRQYLKSVNGQLYIQDIEATLPRPLRERDFCLMDVICSLPNVTRAQHLAFNRVRLYFGVSHLSEISTADGQHIARDAWAGSRLRHSALLWPYQPQPGPKSFRVWRRLLADAFLRTAHRRVSARTRDLLLRTPLQRWLPASESFRCQWDTFFAASTDELFIAGDDGTFRVHPSQRTRRRPKHPVKAFTDTHSATARSLPADAVPVDLRHEPNKLVIPLAVIGIVPSPDPAFPPLQWTDYVASLPQWEQFLLSNVVIPDRPLLLHCLRTNPTLYLAADGGAAECKGSFGCVVANHDCILAECGGPVEGADPKCFRAEGYGLLAILRLVFHLRWFYVTRNQALLFTVYSDSESLLKRIEASLKLTYAVPRRTLFSEADVEMQILDALAAFYPMPILCHVEGHQDTKYPDLPLPWNAQLNKRCDEIATEYLDAATDILRTTSFFPASKVSLTVAHTTITHHIPSQLRYFSGLSEHRAYICRHHGLTLDEYETIDWERLHASTRRLSFLLRLFVIKWVNDLLPLQRQQHRYKQSPSASCPSSCGHHDEDWNHFLRCSHTHRRTSWSDYSKTLSSVFETHNIDPSLRRALLSLLQVITPNTAPIPLDNLPTEYSALLQAQSRLGPNSIFFGLFVNGWLALQDRYLVALQLPRDKHQAASGIHALIASLLEQVHSVWLLRNEHLHGTDPVQQHSYKRLHLLSQIRELYDSSPLMLAGDRDILSFPFHRRQTQTTRSLQNFFSWAKPMVDNSIHVANDLGSRFRRIDDYFRPTIPPELFDVIL
jgi:hypothetical protein